MTGQAMRVHVVFEHGADGQPFGAAELRLLRPLSHPGLAGRVNASFGTDYEGEPVDAVVVDRLWRPDVDGGKAERLVADVRRSGAKLVYALDDSFPDLIAERPDWATPERVAAFETFFEATDGLLVTTDVLADRLRSRNAPAVVVPNALDERLLRPGRWRRALRLRVPRRHDPVVIGYMGTYTHDADLELVAPALRAVHKRYGDGVKFQFLGVVGRAETFEALAGLPVHVVHPEPEQSVYTAFVPWFCNTFRWDIALSPLRDTPFNAAKSDIKFLDYAALGTAGVYSRVPAYVSTVRHGETGWLVDDRGWAETLASLVDDASRRRRTARAASDYLYADRTLARTSLRWDEALRRLLGRPTRVASET